MKEFYKIKEMCSLDMGVKLKENFPILNEKYTTQELIDKLDELNIIFVEEEKVKVNFLVRISVIIAIPLYILLMIFSPINYIIHGRWHYKWIFVINWFKSINLI